MKFCKDCKWVQRKQWCHSPNNGICKVTGEAQVRSVYFARLDIGNSCGSAGVFFEPKDETQVKISLLSKVINWIKGE